MCVIEKIIIRQRKEEKKTVLLLLLILHFMTIACLLILLSFFFVQIDFSVKDRKSHFSSSVIDMTFRSILLIEQSIKKFANLTVKSINTVFFSSMKQRGKKAKKSFCLPVAGAAAIPRRRVFRLALTMDGYPSCVLASLFFFVFDFKEEMNLTDDVYVCAYVYYKKKEEEGTWMWRAFVFCSSYTYDRTRKKKNDNVERRKERKKEKNANC